MARASLTGGAPRSELDGVNFADFGSDGAMAVVREDDRRRTVEYPVGQVLLEVPLVPGRPSTQSGIVVPRVSASGDAVAFFDTRIPSAIKVRVFDKSGASVAESRGFADWWGLAWTPTNEVWFSAAETGGVQTSVYSLDRHGRERVVFRAPGGLTLHDISPQGDVLASFDHVLSRVEFLEGAEAPPTDRTWREGGYLAGFSRAHALLLTQAGDSGGPHGSVYLWQPNDRQPVRIADGLGLALSLDGGKALVASTETPTKVSMVPTGAGQPQALDLGPLASIEWAGWLPDGRIVVEVVRPDAKHVVYALSPDGRNPTALLPEGTTLHGGGLISPDGSRIVANDAAGQFVVCAVATSACSPLAGATAGDEVAGWSADGRSVFVYRKQDVPTPLDRLDVDSGARSAWKIVHPVRPAITGLHRIIASPDGALAYSYSTTRASYVIKGRK